MSDPHEPTPVSETTAAAAPSLEAALGPIDAPAAEPTLTEPPLTAEPAVAEPVFAEADGPQAPQPPPPWPALWPAGATVVGGFGWIAYAIAALVIVLDQISKFWVTNVLDLEHQPPIEVLPVFRLSMVHNQGVSFGLFKAHADTMRWILVGFSVLVVALLVGWARKVERRLTATALGLIIGGAIGNNWIDRVRFGWVVDFLDFSGLHFPWVFNIADSAITIGVVLLLIDSAMRPDAPRQDN